MRKVDIGRNKMKEGVRSYMRTVDAEIEVLKGEIRGDQDSKLKRNVLEKMIADRQAERSKVLSWVRGEGVGDQKRFSDMKDLRVAALTAADAKYRADLELKKIDDIFELWIDVKLSFTDIDGPAVAWDAGDSKWVVNSDYDLSEDELNKLTSYLKAKSPEETKAKGLFNLKLEDVEIWIKRDKAPFKAQQADAKVEIEKFNSGVRDFLGLKGDTRVFDTELFNRSKGFKTADAKMSSLDDLVSREISGIDKTDASIVKSLDRFVGLSDSFSARMKPGVGVTTKASKIDADGFKVKWRLVGEAKPSLTQFFENYAEGFNTLNENLGKVKYLLNQKELEYLENPP